MDITLYYTQTALLLPVAQKWPINKSMNADLSIKTTKTQHVEQTLCAVL